VADCGQEEMRGRAGDLPSPRPSIARKEDGAGTYYGALQEADPGVWPSGKPGNPGPPLAPRWRLECRPLRRHLRCAAVRVVAVSPNLLHSAENSGPPLEQRSVERRSSKPGLPLVAALEVLDCPTRLALLLSPMSGKPVPGGVVHKLPADLREALIVNSTALAAWNGLYE
jgi:hypothetical protein